MSPDQMLARADHVFVGVIEEHAFDRWPVYRVQGEPDYWRVMRRRVRIENVLKGVEPRKEIDIYEIFWTGGASGDWNSTQNGRRYLFLVRVEDGEYHVVRDWWRSIFPVNSGVHSQLPLDDSHPFWERVALLQWWIQPGWSLGIGSEVHKDPAWTLSMWRETKILRGLLHHPDRRLRLMACEYLLTWGRSQDECFQDLTPRERSEHGLAMNALIPQHEWERNRALEPWLARREWPRLISKEPFTASDMDDARLFTSVSNRRQREAFCRDFQKHFPDDRDNGCPADRPPPATIVTKDGDVPLTGAWPVDK